MYAVHTLRLALEPLLQVASVCPFAVLDPPPPTLCLFLPFFAMAHVRTLWKRANKPGVGSQSRLFLSVPLSTTLLRHTQRPGPAPVDRCGRRQEWHWKAAAFACGPLQPLPGVALEGRCDV